jgi:hydroxymethylpyrimidine/phosphomethylpyrimidine kinase
VAGQAPVVLAVSGSDPSTGAGLQADMRSLEAMGLSAATVVTAITVQAGGPVTEVKALASTLVARQMEAVLAAMPVAVVKCGLLPNPAMVRTVARVLQPLALPLVVDPVLEASGGGRLASAGVAPALARHLFPMTTVVTANLDEAAVLAGIKVGDEKAQAEAARRIAGLGAGAVVVKGGHLAGEPTDLLWDGTRMRYFRGPRLGRGSMHGSGCAFASALAGGLALGHSLEESVAGARRHVRAMIVAWL